MKKQYDLETLELIKTKLIAQQATVAVAESVTSGHLQAAFSLATDASQFFQGGITTYNAGQKTRHLGVEPIYALQHNCVVMPVAEQMAIHANTLFLSRYAIGITGYATIMPEIGVNELFAFVAIADRNHIIAQERIMIADNKMDSYAVQVYFTNEALKQLANALS
jgi:PncC family amidohydrolase